MYTTWTSLTPQELSLHRNTLLYRLEKIKELTGCELSEGNEVAELVISLKLLQYRDFMNTPFRPQFMNASESKHN